MSEVPLYAPCECSPPTGYANVACSSNTGDYKSLRDHGQAVSMGVLRSFSSSSPTLCLCLGPYGGPKGVALSQEPSSPVDYHAPG